MYTIVVEWFKTSVQEEVTLSHIEPHYGCLMVVNAVQFGSMLDM
jgi:hypothetical protein